MSRCKIKHRLLVALLLGMIASKGLAGLQGFIPFKDSSGPQVGVRSVELTVATKHYANASPTYVTVIIQDSDFDKDSAVLFIGYQASVNFWINIEQLCDCRFAAIGHLSNPSYAYNRKEIYAVFVSDPNRNLLGKRIRIQYIP